MVSLLANGTNGSSVVSDQMCECSGTYFFALCHVLIEFDERQTHWQDEQTVQDWSVRTLLPPSSPSPSVADYLVVLHV